MTDRTLRPGERGPASPPPLYSESLRCPVSYWAIALGVGLSFVTAVGLYLGEWAAIFCTVATFVLIVTVLWRIGRTRIVVDARGLMVGPSLLEWAYQGEAVVRDREQTRRRLGPEADVRAFVMSRPYVAEAVELAVSDAADPHPYWLISTRRPRQLCAALAQGREAVMEEASGER